MKSPETHDSLITQLKFESSLWADSKRVDERAQGFDGHAIEKRRLAMLAIDKLLDKLSGSMAEIPTQGETEAVITFYTDPVDVRGTE